MHSAFTPIVSAPAGPPASAHDLRTLVLSRHPAIVLETAEEERADALVRGVASDLQMPVWTWTVTRGLAALDSQGGIHGTTDLGQALATVGDLKGDALYVFKDVLKHLTEPKLCRMFRELLASFASPHSMSTALIVGTALELPAELQPHVVHFDLRPPSRDEYRATLQTVIESLGAHQRARVELAPEDYDALITSLTGLSLNQARQALARVAIEDGVLQRADIARIIELKAGVLKEEGLLEYFPPADNPTELGGFAGLRRWLDRAQLARSPRAAELNLPAPRGVLLVGVQGCGKSLAAKYVARAWELPLVKLDAGRLYDKFIGETERNLRKAIATAESLAPCVLWLDEIEKALTPSGDSDGGVSRRVFGSFLTWLQEKRADVFVVATANDLSILPPELLRKGRFDEIFFVDLPTTAERAEILRIHLGLRRQDPARHDLAGLAAAADGFSGAELEQVVITALLQALHEDRPLDDALLLAELQATVPLSRSRHEDVERLRAYARDRFVAVG
jgi:MoxR-like ATPase